MDFPIRYNKEEGKDEESIQSSTILDPGYQWESGIKTQENITHRRGERRGSVVECLTRDRGAAGLSLTGVTALLSLSKKHLSYLSTGST